MGKAWNEHGNRELASIRAGIARREEKLDAAQRLIGEQFAALTAKINDMLDAVIENQQHLK